MSGVDTQYVGLPWKDGGRTRAGVDCVGLAALWLTEQAGVSLDLPATGPETDAATVLQAHCKPIAELVRGDVEFFRERKSGKVRHVTIYLGNDRHLNMVAGYDSRIETGLELLRRLGYERVGIISGTDAPALCAALRDPELGAQVIGPIIVALVLMAISYVLSPSLSGFGNTKGRYGNDALVTQKNPEIPLPDLLGKVVVAGNSVYQQLADRNESVDNSPPQAWNQVIILNSGPCEEIDYYAGLQIKGITWSDKYFYDETNISGIKVNPTQNKAQAVSGSIAGETYVPSVTLYDGAFGISVPVDVRAQYDRGFPVYGFSGCSYLVFRCMDSSKFGSFNVTCRVKGRKCRTFDENGFIVNTVTSEAVGTGDSTTRRWKLAFEDVASVASVTVNGSAWTELDASHQTGNVYAVNRIKGYIEFPDNIPGAFAIVATYDYYPREWTDNPAAQIVYLLTESLRGKGLPESKLNWQSFADAQDYFDETVDWTNSSGVVSAARFRANYALDYRKPVQDHLRAILDACRADLFLAGGKFVLMPRSSVSSVFSFNDSNILVDDQGDSTFEAEQVDRAGLPNRIKALFHSEENLNAETEVIVDDDANQLDREPRIGNFGVVDDNLKYPAITTQAQAERIATAQLAENGGGNWIYRWKTTIKGLALLVGDVVDVTNAAVGSTAVLVRIEKLELDEQDRLMIEASKLVSEAVGI